MPRFSANLSMLFADVPLLGRFDRARAAGFDAVELQFPYEVAADAIRRRLSDNGLKLVLHNLPAGDWAAGDRGIACNPERQQEFRDGIAKGIDYAKALDVPQLNCLSGMAGGDVTEHIAHRTFIENLHFAAGECRNSNLGLLIEPVNSRDVPGFWLDTVSKALPILDEVVDVELVQAVRKSFLAPLGLGVEQRTKLIRECGIVRRMLAQRPLGQSAVYAVKVRDNVL